MNNSKRYKCKLDYSITFSTTPIGQFYETLGEKINGTIKSINRTTYVRTCYILDDQAEVTTGFPTVKTISEKVVEVRQNKGIVHLTYVSERKVKLS